MECSTVCIDPSADGTAGKEGDIQSRHRTPPQHHLHGPGGADGIEEGEGKTPRAKS